MIDFFTSTIKISEFNSLLELAVALNAAGFLFKDSIQEKIKNFKKFSSDKKSGAMAIKEDLEGKDLSQSEVEELNRAVVDIANFDSTMNEFKNSSFRLKLFHFFSHPVLLLVVLIISILFLFLGSASVLINSIGIYIATAFLLSPLFISTFCITSFYTSAKKKAESL